MSKPSFVVSAADLDRGPKSVTWPIPEAWLRAALEGSDARPVGEEGELVAELSKNGREVLVRGRARATVEMDCVVTLDPLRFELTPELLLLLSPSANAAPSRERRRGPGEGGRREPKPAKGGKAPNPGWNDDPELSNEDAARDRFDGERIVLDDFLREFLLLELPAYPRRSDLPSDQTAAIAPPAARAADEPAVDPRLMPLAAIASRLRQGTKE